jgi:DNA polymerase III subunit alpha
VTRSTVWFRGEFAAERTRKTEKAFIRFAEGLPSFFVSSDQFVHLHLHTCYSLLDGACRIGDLVAACGQKNMPSMAMTDHGVMYGTVEFYKAAKKAQIKPIIGCEAYITTGSRFDRTPVSQGGARSHHLVLLAANEMGYYNLIRLISAGHVEGFYYKPRIDREILAQHASGLIALASCLQGEVTSRLTDGDMEGAVEVTGAYTDIFGKDNFFIEVQDHGIAEQRKVVSLAPELARRTGCRIVATNDVHYLEKSHAAAHEVMLCLQTQTVLSDPKRMRYASSEFFLKDRAEMATLFPDNPEWLDITLEIAERCNVELDFETTHFPTYELPKGSNQRSYLREQSMEGVRRLYGLEDAQHPKDDREREILERFEHEFHVIEETGFVNYFLVVWDFMRFAREKKIPVGPGRGSGGGSLIAYVLGITAIDPLHYDLIFERFLNPERVSPPDFDIDFCMERRGEVIEYVKEKYGTENVAQIITFGSLGAKTVIRDVGRVLEVPFSECDRLSKMVPDDLKMTLKKALEQNPEFKAAYDTDEQCRRILDYGFVLEGLYRNPGTHAAGVVIGEKPLREIVPLCLDRDKVQPVTQYSKYPVEEIGLLKMDFLGLKTLTVLQEATDLVREAKGEDIDLERLPLDDGPTYELLSRGDTIGVFQLESSGMRDLIRRISMNRIEDLIAMIALYRPGPMNMLPDYVDRKCGKTRVKYDHPLLEEVLEETYGVMVYQEQVQRAANVLAGYSLGEADLLRRAMGKKIPEVMAKQRTKFVEGCAATNNIPKALAERIFDNMEKFAGYGFNKAHSTGYAIISYQTAYMKANYPAEFMSALLSCEMGNFDKLPVFIVEAENMGLEILPPDVNGSGIRFKPEEQGIRFGLAGIKNVGAGAAEAVVAEGKNGPFESLVDFCGRIDASQVNKKVMESLVRSGAMDGLNMHRARLFNGVDFAMARAADAQRDRETGQGSLFDLMQDEQNPVTMDSLPDSLPWHESELLAGERELLGIYMSGHPLTQFAPLLERYQLTTVEGLAELEDRALTRLGGIISSVTKRVTKTKKELMAILQVEDLDGAMEAVVFPECYQRYGVHAQEDAAVLICGEVSKKDDRPKLIAHELYPLADAPKIFAKRLGVHVPVTAADKLETVRDILRLHPGEVSVVVCLQYPTGEKVFLETDTAFRVLPDEELVQELQRELGEKSVYVAVNPSPCKHGRPDNKRRWKKNGNGD